MAATNYLDELAKQRQLYGQRLADYPQTAQDIRSEIYGGDKVLPTLRSTRDDAISQLWDVDKRLAERYANPQSETFIRDPYKREQLAAGQHQSVLGAVSGADRLVQAREDMLGENLTKALDLLRLKLEGEATQYNMLLNEAKLADSGAGTGGLDLASTLALLGLKGGQKGTTETGRGATLDPREMFKARILSGADTSKQFAEEPTGLSKIFQRIIPPRESVTQLPDVAIQPDIAKQILASRPTPTTDVGAEGLGDLSSLGLSGIDIPTLTYISQNAPKFGNKIAEKLIMEQIFPSTSSDEWTPQKREAYLSILKNVEDFNSDETPPSESDFLSRMIQLHPEMTPEEIRDMLIDLGVIVTF